jgi:hypothetical protein
MKTIQLTTDDVRPAEEVEALQGTFLDESSYRHILRNETGVVLKPDGTPLVIYVRDAIPRSLCAAAFEVFKKVSYEGGGTNRGMAAGLIQDGDERIDGDGAEVRGVRYNPRKLDGTLSATSRSASVPTAIVGFYGRYPRIPYCRQTAFTMNNPELWQRCLPYVAKVSDLFRQYAPRHFAAQKAFTDACHPDFIIPDTVYSTITLNRNWRTAVHTDKGDYRSGLGCMSVLEGGHYDGGELVFPRFNTAVDMRTGGVCFADVHELHGNVDIRGAAGMHLRISAVFYCRENVAECGSMEYELERAREVGDRISTEHATTSPRLF